MSARASISPDPSKRTRVHRPAGLESDDVTRQHHLGAEAGHLRDRAMGEVRAGQSLREAEVVLDRRALPGLAAGRLALDDDRAQALRRRVHGGSQTRRAGADDADVVQRLLRPVRRPSAPASSRVDGERSVSPSGTSTSGRSVGLRLGQVAQPLALGVALDVVPAVWHVVAGQEGLDLVAALGPPVPDDADVGRVVRVGLRPVAEQVVDDGVEPLFGRIPRLEQVVVQADVVDRLDRDVGVGVRGEQEVLRARRWVRACSSISMPVICGIRWSDTISATGWLRSASLVRTVKAWAPDVARTMR